VHAVAQPSMCLTATLFILSWCAAGLSHTATTTRTEKAMYEPLTPWCMFNPRLAKVSNMLCSHSCCPTVGLCLCGQLPCSILPVRAVQACTSSCLYDGQTTEACPRRELRMPRLPRRAELTPSASFSGLSIIQA
jgi:hypothetical protein